MNNKNELIFELIANDLSITNLNMQEIGLTENDIKEMLEDNFLFKISNNEYELKDTDLLYQYGVKLLKFGYINKSYSCFKKCFEIEPNNRKYCIQLILYWFRKAYYDEVFELFPLLEKTNSEKSIKENNLYLYLLSIAYRTRVPKQYYERAKNLNSSDFIISYTNKSEYKDVTNTIVVAIIKNKYKYALKLVNDEIAKQSDDIVNFSFLKELLNGVLRQENKFKFDLVKFIQNKQYDKVVEYLEAKQKKRLLRSDELYIYMIAQSIMNLLETRQVPIVTVDSTVYVYDAIKGNNFELAKILNYNYKVVNNRTNGIDMIDILLSDIIELMAQIQYENTLETNGPVLKKQM